MTWIRVRDNGTGHEYDVDSRAVDPEAHTPLNDDHYPDLTHDWAEAREPKNRTDLAGKPAGTQAKHKATDKNGPS